MATIERTRTLRPSTRQRTSPYKVDTKRVGRPDSLRLTIFTEEKPMCAIGVFEFAGSDLASRDSIHFSAEEHQKKWRIKFTGAQPGSYLLG